MSRDDGYSDDIDWLDVGSADEASGPPRLPWPRWLTLAVAGAVIAVVVAAVNVERRHPTASPAKPAATTSVAAQPAPVTPAPETSLPAPPSARPVVTELGHPVLNTTDGWELFGRGPGVLVRIQLAAGRITRTAIPDLRSSGPVYLVAGPDQVMVRPLDNVPGYLVPDGRPARDLDVLVNEGPVFPGPDPTRLWLQPVYDTKPMLALTTFDGHDSTAVIPIPDGSSPMEAAPDGAGYLLFPGIGGVYDARPEGLRRITTGSLVATGPTGWLVVECDTTYRCQTVLVGRVDGSRRIVPNQETNRDSRGVISPDGSTAAMSRTGPHGEAQLYLLDLASGRRRVPDIVLNPDAYDGAVAFSPDSKWLFAVRSDGTIAVIDPQTAEVRSLGISLPALSQLIVRPAPAGPGGSALAKALTRTCCRPVPAK
jgi:WD40 repeat protein